MSAPNVRGFFDPATATWTYVVWSDTDTQRRCAVIDSVLDFDLHDVRSPLALARRCRPGADHCRAPAVPALQAA